MKKLIFALVLTLPLALFVGCGDEVTKVYLPDHLTIDGVVRDTDYKDYQYEYWDNSTAGNVISGYFIVNYSEKEGQKLCDPWYGQVKYSDLDSNFVSTSRWYWIQVYGGEPNQEGEIVDYDNSYDFYLYPGKEGYEEYRQTTFTFDYYDEENDIYYNVQFTRPE